MNSSSFYFIIHILVIHTHTFFVLCHDIDVNFSIFDNDDIKLLKRHAVFLSVIFLLKCFVTATLKLGPQRGTYLLHFTPRDGVVLLVQ